MALGIEGMLHWIVSSLVSACLFFRRVSMLDLVVATSVMICLCLVIGWFVAYG